MLIFLPFSIQQLQNLLFYMTPCLFLYTAARACESFGMCAIFSQSWDWLPCSSFVEAWLWLFALKQIKSGEVDFSRMNDILQGICLSWGHYTVSSVEKKGAWGVCRFKLLRLICWYAPISQFRSLTLTRRPVKTIHSVSFSSLPLLGLLCRTSVLWLLLRGPVAFLVWLKLATLRLLFSFFNQEPDYSTVLKISLPPYNLSATATTYPQTLSH